MAMIVLYVLGYFNRNKQNSYAAFTWHALPPEPKEVNSLKSVGILVSLVHFHVFMILTF